MNSNILLQQYLLFNEYDKETVCFIQINKIMIYAPFCGDNVKLSERYNNLKDIIWKYDEHNYRIPYINGIKIEYYWLDENDNIFDFISSCSFINNSNIISGEKIQKIADIVLGSPNSLEWNPNNIFYSKGLSTIDSISNIEKYNSIFVFTHDLELFYSKFGDQINDKIIISHNSDHEINYISNVKLHLAQNCLVSHKLDTLSNCHKLISIPIGIENKQWFDHAIFEEVREMNIKKSKDIYFYFSLDTHFTRRDCYDKLKDKLTWNVKRSKEDYFKELACHKYAICPRGNGLDTHRIWECLYLNVIPIVHKNDFINIDNLPIIILHDWCDIDNIPCEFSNQKLSKLTVDYYQDIINKIY
jgi:hypothetical protein